jgi:hypothetical protein
VRFVLRHQPRSIIEFPYSGLSIASGPPARRDSKIQRSAKLKCVIQNHFRNWWNKPLPFSELQKAIGMSYRQNFNQDIRRHPDFREALIGMQVSEFSPNKSKRLTHFRLWE